MNCPPVFNLLQYPDCRNLQLDCTLADFRFCFRTPLGIRSAKHGAEEFLQEEYHFDGQRPDEDVVFVSKRHPWVLASAGFLSVAMIVILILLILFFGFSHIISIVIIAVVLFFLIYGFYQWFIYNNYIYILTSQRIIIIEQAGLFGRKVTEAELEKIQNLTVEVKGPISTMLNFGNITVRTAGIDPVMVLNSVENPYELQQKILKYAKNSSGGLSKQNIIR